MVDFLTKKIEEYQKKELEENQPQQFYGQYPEQEQQMFFPIKQVRDFYSNWASATENPESEYHQNHQYFKQTLDNYNEKIEELEKQGIEVSTFPISDDYYNAAIKQQYAMQQQTVQSSQTTASPGATSSSDELENPDSPAHFSKRQKAETAADDVGTIKSDKGISVTKAMKLEDVGKSGQPKGRDS